MRHSTKAEKFFTKDEREKIKATTCQIEKCTSGEVAVMIVDSSDTYPEAAFAGGIIFAGLLSLAITASFFHASMWWYIPLNFVFFFPFRFIFGKFPRLKTALVGRKRISLAVRQRAIRAFYEKGLYRTKNHTGILFFLSLLERKVWVLADKGIHEKIEQQTLNRFARAVSRGVRENRACEALCESMREAGDLLARHFPSEPGDTDELTNDVITG